MNVWLALALEVICEATAIALMAYAMAMLSRTTGVYILESVILATTAALAVAAAAAPDVTHRPSVQSLVLPSLWALILVLAMLGPYRAFRRSRGGDATSLIMSFALMNALAAYSISSSEGKSLSISALVADNRLWPALAGLLILLIVIITSRSAKLQAMLRLARDDDNFLQNFNISGRAVRAGTTAVVCLVLSVGVLIYIGRQQTFSVARYEAFLIPVFGVAICQADPKIRTVVWLALLLSIAEEGMRFLGEPVLHRAYQGFLLIGLVLVSQLRFEGEWRGLRVRAS